MALNDDMPTIGPMMPARMIFADRYSEIQRKVKKETRMRISTTVASVLVVVDTRFQARRRRRTLGLMVLQKWSSVWVAAGRGHSNLHEECREMQS
jgi:hypothetical protein